MSCLNPRIRIPVPETVAEEGSSFFLSAFKDSSNSDLVTWADKRFATYAVCKVHNGGVLLNSAVDPLIYFPDVVKCYPDAQTVSCGRCASCRLAERQLWTYRLLLEAESYPGRCLFFTLTYDEEHLIHGRYRVRYDSSGSPWLEPFPTLFYPHVQLFAKALRRYADYHLNGRQLKLYYCGEYGSKTGRPHYHLIVYGLSLLEALSLNLPSDPKFVGRVGSGQRYSRLIADLWKRGYCAVASADYSKIQYVAGYVLKKMQADEEDKHIVDYYRAIGEVIDWDSLPLDPSNNHASQFEYFRGNERLKRPDLLIEKERRTAGNGIGRSYFETHFREMYDLDSPTHDTFTISWKGHTLHPRPFAYFDSLYDKIDPDGLQVTKRLRRVSGLADRLSLIDLLKKCNISTKTYQNQQRISAEHRLTVGVNLRTVRSASSL